MSLLETRGRTDNDIPTRWVWAPVSSYTVWTAIPIISYIYGPTGTELMVPLGILGLAGFVFSTASSHLVYQLVNRRNTHFARQEVLLWKALDAARSKASPTDMKTRIPLNSAEQDLGKLGETGREHSAILWTILTLIPYLGWIAMIYVLAFLSNDIWKHEVREDLVLEDLGRVLKEQGGTNLPVRRVRVPNRPVIAYVAASILTLGVFLLLWLLLAVEDPRAHFEYHRHFEEALVGPQPTIPPVAGGMM